MHIFLSNTDFKFMASFSVLLFLLCCIFLLLDLSSCSGEDGGGSAEELANLVRKDAEAIKEIGAQMMVDYEHFLKFEDAVVSSSILAQVYKDTAWGDRALQLLWRIEPRHPTARLLLSKALIARQDDRCYNRAISELKKGVFEPLWAYPQLCEFMGSQALLWKGAPKVNPRFVDDLDESFEVGCGLDGIRVMYFREEYETTKNNRIRDDDDDDDGDDEMAATAVEPGKFYVNVQPSSFLLFGSFGIEWSLFPSLYTADSVFLQLVYSILKTKMETSGKHTMTMVDIGANTGSFALMATVLPTLTVHAFEASPLTHRVLQKNVDCNGVSNRVSTYPIALTNFAGSISFSVPNSYMQAAFAKIQELQEKVVENNVNYDVVEVEADTIDGWKEKHKDQVKTIDFIKVDAEGAELDIIKGAMQTLKNDGPDILVEANQNTMDFIALLQPLGYVQVPLKHRSNESAVDHNEDDYIGAVIHKEKREVDQYLIDRDFDWNRMTEFDDPILSASLLAQAYKSTVFSTRALQLLWRLEPRHPVASMLIAQRLLQRRDEPSYKSALFELENHVFKRLWSHPNLCQFVASQALMWREVPALTTRFVDDLDASFERGCGIDGITVTYLQKPDEEDSITEKISVKLTSFLLGGSFAIVPGVFGAMVTMETGLISTVYKRIIHKKYLKGAGSDPDASAVITMLDIGANTGSFSLLPRVVTDLYVHAFEPSPITLKVLRKNIESNMLNDRVKTYPIALMDEVPASGKVSFAIATSCFESAFSRIGEADKVSQSVEVEADTIDGWKEKHKDQVKTIDFIKVDAEGAELDIIKGAMQTLKNDGPDILVEANQKTMDFIALLQPLGYTQLPINHPFDILFIKTK